MYIRKGVGATRAPPFEKRNSRIDVDFIYFTDANFFQIIKTFGVLTETLDNQNLNSGL